jgi:hypothetical protein
LACEGLAVDCSLFRPRSGARWYEGEAGELAAAFQSGRSIAELARAHNRSAFAIEAQLERQGLWDRAAGQATPVASGARMGGSEGRFTGPVSSVVDRD